MSNTSDSLTSAAAGRGLKTGLEKVRRGSVPGRPVSIFLGPDALSTAHANDGARAVAKAPWSMHGWCGCRGGAVEECSERLSESGVQFSLVGDVLIECCSESLNRIARNIFGFDGDFCGVVVGRWAGAFAAFCFGGHWKNRASGELRSVQQRRGSCAAAARRIADDRLRYADVGGSARGKTNRRQRA